MTTTARRDDWFIYVETLAPTEPLAFRLRPLFCMLPRFRTYVYRAERQGTALRLADLLREHLGLDPCRDPFDELPVEESVRDGEDGERVGEWEPWRGEPAPGATVAVGFAPRSALWFHLGEAETLLIEDELRERPHEHAGFLSRWERKLRPDGPWFVCRTEFDDAVGHQESVAVYEAVDEAEAEAVATAMSKRAGSSAADLELGGFHRGYVPVVADGDVGMLLAMRDEVGEAAADAGDDSEHAMCRRFAASFRGHHEPTEPAATRAAYPQQNPAVGSGMSATVGQDDAGAPPAADPVPAAAAPQNAAEPDESRYLPPSGFPDALNAETLRKAKDAGHVRGRQPVPGRGKPWHYHEADVRARWPQHFPPPQSAAQNPTAGRKPAESRAEEGGKRRKAG